MSVVESLRRVTKHEATIDKYKVVLPETMLEGLASDSEDEGVDEPEVYRYLTVDNMKSLGDDVCANAHLNLYFNYIYFFYLIYSQCRWMSKELWMTWKK